jgi:hypothetical protein
VKPTTYELLTLLDRSLRESVSLLKKLAECPGQRSDVLKPLSNEVQYVRAQAGFEVTTEASDFEQDQATHWSRIHHKYEMWLKDPDDAFLDAEGRDERRKKAGPSTADRRPAFVRWGGREGPCREESAGCKETQGNAQTNCLTEGSCRKAEKMKIHLFQELRALNEEFGHVIHGLERMEKDSS